jgi:hypothetical protein
MIYTHVAAGLLGAAIAAAGAWQTQEWRHGAIEAKRLQAEQVARDAQERDAQAQRDFNQTRAGLHAAALAGINTQLGDARAHIAALSTTRICLGAGTVSVLNNIGKPTGLALRAPAGQSDGAAPAPAGSVDNPGEGASERDTAEHIALCRARYAEVSSQLGQILDIEERRQGRAP